MALDLLFDRNEHPFSKSWERWAASWCIWLLSIPKKENPSLDRTGKYCSLNQNNQNVWFLTGTFGNIKQIKRRCVLPSWKAIFFPILVKEDSFAEDSDLATEADLIKRCEQATNRLINIEASIDDQKIVHLENYRARSEVFDLTFPKDNVYNVRPGLTRSVCDGYWLFIKPLPAGTHSIFFRGETLLNEPYTINQLKGNEIHRPIWKHIDKGSRFKLEVYYDLTVTNESSSF
jgi:hypothetical protein